MWEAIKIVLLSIAAAVCYGILHDQITAHLCVEYFTHFHPQVFNTDSPTLLALGWGVIATWWVGLIIGLPLALIARLGPWPRLTARELRLPIVRLMAACAVGALLAGMLGYFLAATSLISTQLPYVLGLQPSRYARFMADLWAHNASYLMGFCGGVVLCGWAVRKRIELREVFKP